MIGEDLTDAGTTDLLEDFLVAVLSKIYKMAGNNDIERQTFAS